MTAHAPIRTVGEEALLARLAAAPSAAGEAARTAIAAAGLPGRRVEAFKWSDLRAALADGLPAGEGPAPAAPAFLPDDALILAFAADGVSVSGAPEPGFELDVEEAGPAASGEVTPALAAALAPRTLVARAEKALRRPIVLLRGPGAPARLKLEVGEGAALTLIDLSDASAGLSTLLVEADVAAHGRLTRLTTQTGGPGAVDLVRVDVRLAEEAAYHATALAFGGRFARAETFVTLAGPRAACTLNGAYLVAGGLHADATTRVEHLAPGGVTRELYKGAAADRARGVFQGKILVRCEAQDTDARQNHHALLLSEGAEIDAKPELEIYADAVSCAHGATIGALNEDAVFYARARGLPLHEAKALLVQAFIAEVFDGVSHEKARAWLAGLAAAWLEARA